MTDRDDEIIARARRFAAVAEEIAPDATPTARLGLVKQMLAQATEQQPAYGAALIVDAGAIVGGSIEDVPEIPAAVATGRTEPFPEPPLPAAGRILDS